MLEKLAQKHPHCGLPVIASVMREEKMGHKFITIPLVLLIIVGFSGCKNEKIQKNNQMEAKARTTILNYLANNDLPENGLSSFESSVKPTPDYSYLYTGENRCIEFIVYCNGEDCAEWKKYPFDEHGDECPSLGSE